MTARDPLDFWYAVRNTTLVVVPPRRLETFGTTTLNYRLVTEPMDAVDKVRVREGRIHAFRPQIVAPGALNETALEGFREKAAGAYLDWLREHAADLMLVQYGFRIRMQGQREEVLSDSIDAVVDRIKADMAQRADPLAALVRGVDEPWEVCLLKLMVEMVQRSGPHHARELRADPTGARHEIEQRFRAAARDPARIDELAAALRHHGLFEEYQDRFFTLVRRARG